MPYEPFSTPINHEDRISDAQADLQSAQATLEQAQSHKNTVSYQPSNPSAMMKWHRAVDALQTAREKFAQAEAAFMKAQNDAAAARWGAKLQAQEAERKATRDLEASQRAQIEEHTAKESTQRAYLAAGGTLELFEKSWPRLWAEQLEERAKQIQANERKAMLSSGRYNF